MKRLIKKEEYLTQTGIDSLVKTIEYIYESDLIVRANISGELEYRKYFYNEQGNIDSTYLYYETGQVKKISYYEYSDNKHIYFNLDIPKIESSFTNYPYYNKNEIIKSKDQGYDLNGVQNLWNENEYNSTVLEYNNYGYPIKRLIAEPDHYAEYEYIDCE